jgi:hypothetical protein
MDPGPSLGAIHPHTQPVASFSVGPIPILPTLEPILPKSPTLKNIVEPVGLWGQPSFYSCLDMLDECGEASGACHGLSVTPPSSPTMRPQVTDKLKARWSPRSSTPVALKTSMVCPEPIGDDGYPLTPSSAGQTLALPLVLFNDDETTEARHLMCVPLQSVLPTSKPKETFEVEAERSKWQDNQYRRFSKQMGVSIVGFESQCYSLLRRIDEERKKKLVELGPRQLSMFGKKHVKEL